MILSQTTDPAEPLLLEHRDRYVMEEGSRNRATFHVLRVALDRSSPKTADFPQGAVEGDGCDTRVPMVPIHEEASDSPVWEVFETFRVGSPVFNARKLVGRPELTPAYAGGTIVYQGSVSLPFPDPSFLEGSGLAGTCALRVKRHAPTAAPYALVLLDEPGEVRPSIRCQRLHGVVLHGRPCCLPLSPRPPAASTRKDCNQEVSTRHPRGRTAPATVV